MADRWWVIHEEELHSALLRTEHGESADMVLIELTANSIKEDVDPDA